MVDPPTWRRSWTISQRPSRFLKKTRLANSCLSIASTPSSPWLPIQELSPKWNSGSPSWMVLLRWRGAGSRTLYIASTMETRYPWPVLFKRCMASFPDTAGMADTGGSAEGRTRSRLAWERRTALPTVSAAAVLAAVGLAEADLVEEALGGTVMAADTAGGCGVGGE